MKKIFMTLSAGAMLSAAIILGGCNNAEEVKKQTDAQNAAIQALVDAKLGGLQDQVNAECTAKVDSVANMKYEEWKKSESKGKKGSKPKAKPEERKVVQNKNVSAVKVMNIGTKTTISPGNVSNRKGANQNNGSNVSNRNGATTPPK